MFLFSYVWFYLLLMHCICECIVLCVESRWEYISDENNFFFDFYGPNFFNFELQINNLSAMEVNIVRPFIGRALQAFYKHDSPELIPDQERISDRRPQVANNAARVCSCFICLLFLFFFCFSYCLWEQQRFSAKLITLPFGWCN